MKTFALITLQLLIFGSILQAQATFLSGRVVSEDRQPFEFANVLLLSAADSTLLKGSVTDSLGVFTFADIQTGDYLISATMIGYEAAYSETFTLKGASTFKVPILTITAGGVNLEEVVVSGQKPFMELKMDKLVMNVAASPVAAGNTALEVLTKAPGVVVDQQDNLSLRGKQGVLVLIDGKNTYMSNEELIKMLAAMSADDIESIEIMNNPSAKYDAAGNAGIINIKTKRDRSLGLNGSYTATAGMGNFPRASSGLNLNYRNKKINLFGNYSFYFRRRFQNLELFREVPFEGDVTIFDQNSYRVSETYSNRLKVGADYFLNDKTTIGFLMNGQFGTWGEVADNKTMISGDNLEVFNEVRADNDVDEEWDNFSYNFNIKHQFDNEGHEINFDADYSSYQRAVDGIYDNRFFDGGDTEVADPNLLQTNNLSDVTIRAVKLDYAKPLSGQLRMEAGAKASFVSTDNGIDFFVNEDGAWVDDLTRTNQFLYDENIYAAYLNLSTQIKQFNIQLGLRGEQTDAEGYSVTLDERFRRDYFNLFPSVSISHPIGEQHQISYAYSRRVDRPSYQDLNPFIFFLDQYTFEKGNTNLGPQFSNTLGVNYSYKGRYMISFNYSDTKDAITEVIDQDDENKISFQTKDNLASFKNYSLTLSAPVNFTTWWTSRFNVSSFYNDFNSPLANGVVDNEILAYRINFSQNINIAKKWFMQLNTNYQSKSIWGIYEVDPQWSMDVGLSTNILKNRGKLRLNVNDIFFTRIFQVDIQQGTVNIRVRNVNESRVANLSFSYNFGNNEVKSARRRRTATEEEQNRASNK